jgi:hypothetical protein
MSDLPSIARRLLIRLSMNDVSSIARRLLIRLSLCQRERIKGEGLLRKCCSKDRGEAGYVIANE